MFNELESLPSSYTTNYSDDMKSIINKYVPVQAVYKETETMLWYKRLGHIHGEALAQTH